MEQTNSTLEQIRQDLQASIKDLELQIKQNLIFKDVGQQSKLIESKRKND